MRKLLIITIIIATCANLFAQNIEISGNLIESDTGEEVPFATVMLLNESDSTLLEYAISGSDGHFVFKSVKNRDYLLKISHITYTPYQKKINKTDGKNINLGNIKLSPIAEVLMEVVVHEAQAPLLFKGDTVEYNAATFKVAPGSTVEDLLKKLPGIEVNADGGISSMGKDVNKVYVDGKNFFGDDPKMVTQNLDAEAVSKVQVYTEQSEQEKLTGIKDGNQDKVMNLELKQEYKKGYFGKASVGGGWGDGNFIPWLAKGSFNHFNDKYQLSLIGYGNDINSTRTDFDDMKEFKGSSMFTHDNGDFGFGNDNYWWMNIGMGNWDGNGFAQNYGGGINFNYDDGKTILYTNYTYNQINSEADLFSNTRTMLTDTSYMHTDTTTNSKKNFSHSISARLEEKIDSLDYFIIRANANFSGNRNYSNELALYQAENLNPINQLTQADTSKLNKINTDVLAIYNRKFMRPRRSFSISVQNNNTISLQKRDEDNLNEFFNATTDDERIKVASSQNTNNNKLKSSIMYVEPFGKRFSLSTFYNFAMNTEKLTNEAMDEIANSSVDSLGLVSKREFFYNRIGAQFGYSYKGLYWTVGAAYKNIQQNGTYTKSNVEGDPLHRNYGSFIPYAEIQWESGSIWTSASYSYNISEPDFSYLQPISTNTDPLYIVLGNPNLSYTSDHDLRFDIGHHNQVTFFSVWGDFSYSYQPDLITYNQKIEFVDGLGYRNVRTPEIVHNGQSISTMIHFGIPIIKSKLTLNISANYSNQKNPTFINGVENATNTNSVRPNMSLQINLSDKLTWRINGSMSYGMTTYTSKTTDYYNENETFTYNAGTSLKWQIFGRTYLEANYKYNKYTNSEFQNNPDMHILNVSIKQYLGKGNKFELRLAACDLLNQSMSIAQYASSNIVFYRESPTLSRYYMLTFSYNMKGFQDNKGRGMVNYIEY